MTPKRKRLVLLVASLLLSLATAEICARLLDPHARDHAVPGGLFAIDPELGWRLAPAKRLRHRTRHFEVTYTTNRLGFRDPERSPDRAPGTRRLLLFGDSQPFGWGVEDGERFSRRLEARVPGLEVWNLSVPGHGLDQEVLYYRQIADSWPADGAVFYVSVLSLERMRQGFLYQKYKPRFELEPGDGLRLVPVPAGRDAAARLVYRALSPFHLPYFLERRLARLRAPHASATSAPPVDDLARRVLALAAETAKRHGGRATVLADLPQATRDEMRRFSAEAGLGFWELEVRGAIPGEMTLGRYDQHWNPRGHDAASAQLARQIDAALPGEP